MLGWVDPGCDGDPRWLGWPAGEALGVSGIGGAEGSQEDLPRPSMRTLGAELVRGRWSRSAIGRSPMKPLGVGGVAVLPRCTACGPAGKARGPELPIFRRLCRSTRVHGQAA